LLKTIKTQLAVYRQAVLKWAFEDKKFEMVKLKQISDAFGGGAFKSTDFLTSGKYQVIRIGNVRPGVIRYNEKPIYLNKLNEKENKYLLKKEDIVITLTGTRKKRDYGFTALIDQDNLVLNQRVAAIRFSKNYLPEFFMYYSWTDRFKDDFFADETGNVGQGNVGMKAITETLVPICTIPEQQAIVSAIESRLSECDKLEQTIDDALALSASLRQSILKKAFEGRLVPQDPNDEPAEKLLERIKAGKAAMLAKQKQVKKSGKNYRKK
jgi:type I restriction enzyme S subunit